MDLPHGQLGARPLTGTHLALRRQDQREGGAMSRKGMIVPVLGLLLGVGACNPQKEAARHEAKAREQTAQAREDIKKGQEKASEEMQQAREKAREDIKESAEERRKAEEARARAAG